MDCLTTVIGTSYLKTIELNPLVAWLINTNIQAFIAIKLAITVFAGLVFLMAEKTLTKTLNYNSKTLRVSRNALRLGVFGLLCFLIIVVANNFFVIIKMLI